jgi:phenylpropionate dioxygenase-like ring-hydroxylating dioxygenase large terminal subunit
VWEGFIYVNLAAEPEQGLRDFLGPLLQGLEGYPFHEMTERYHYKTTVNANWKLFYDAFQEIYHAPALHGNQTPNIDRSVQMRPLKAPYYELCSPHRVMQPTGFSTTEKVATLRGMDLLKPIERLTRASLIGPFEGRDLTHTAPRLNPGGYKNWLISSFMQFPNTTILIRATGWFLTYSYWPTSYNTLTFEGNLYFPKPKNIRERIAHEVAKATHKEFALQDANTLEATQRALESGVLTEFPLSDHEILCRHLHKEVGDRVQAYKQELADKQAAASAAAGTAGSPA